MHDLITRNETETVPIPRARKANECMIAAKQRAPQEMLFDEFWRRGELALLFGAPGTGKSVLATQIADRVARGGPIQGFYMGKKRQKVLYVDLKLSERQFAARYSHRVPGSSRVKAYKFSENLYRAAPGPSDDLCEWLREITCRDGIRVVIIDELSALRTTPYGARETLKLMRRLKELRDDLDLSILVLAGAREAMRRHGLRESDMQGERVLCDAAESVFAIGWQRPDSRANRYLVQTRSSAAPLVWIGSKGPVCRIMRTDEGCLEFKFDERFEPVIDQERLELICNVKAMRDAGASWRLIEEDLGISRTTASRLCKQWKPELEHGFVRGLDQEAGDDEGREFLEVPVPGPPVSAEVPGDVPEAAVVEDAQTVEILETTASPADECVDSVPAIMLALGMQTRLDERGREIFVERENESGKPEIWYKFNPKGQLLRCERNYFRVNWIAVDGPVCPWDRVRNGLSPPS